jgi:hypothetical protein
MASKIHCENCGQENPDMIPGEGYTACCNELICDGFTSDRWATEKGPIIRACCGAHADDKAREQGYGYATERL